MIRYMTFSRIAPIWRSSKEELLLQVVPLAKDENLRLIWVYHPGYPLVHGFLQSTHVRMVPYHLVFRRYLRIRISPSFER